MVAIMWYITYDDLHKLLWVTGRNIFRVCILQIILASVMVLSTQTAYIQSIFQGIHDWRITCYCLLDEFIHLLWAGNRTAIRDDFPYWIVYGGEMNIKELPVWGRKCYHGNGNQVYYIRNSLIRWRKSFNYRHQVKIIYFVKFLLHFFRLKG